jgi:MFS family permease
MLLATVTGTATAMLGLGGVNVLFVPFLVNELHETPVWAGPLEAAQTLSMILAGATVAALAARLRPATIVTGSLFGVALVIGGLAAVPNVGGMFVVLFAVGWFVTPLQAATTTILQTATVDAMRGRIAAAFQACMSTTTIVSTAVTGVVADIIGIRQVIAVAGVIVALGAVAAGLLYAADRRPAPRAAPDATAAPVA